MNKEQLLKLIELLPIEELNGFKIYYYSQIKPKDNGYGYTKQDEREEHNVSYGVDFEQLMLQKLDNANDKIKYLQDTVYQLQISKED